MEQVLVLKRPADVLVKDFRRAVKRGIEGAGVYWFQRMLPKHFTVAGAQEYGYAPRRGWLQRLKRKKGRGNIPLVFSGLLRAAMLVRPPQPKTKGVTGAGEFEGGRKAASVTFEFTGLPFYTRMLGGVEQTTRGGLRTHWKARMFHGARQAARKYGSVNPFHFLGPNKAEEMTIVSMGESEELVRAMREVTDGMLSVGGGEKRIK
jgi:hypothetical protein